MFLNGRWLGSDQKVGVGTKYSRPEGLHSATKFWSRSVPQGFQTFLGPKFCADYENHSHFSVTSSVYKIFQKTGIPDFAYVVVSSESPCTIRFFEMS